MENQEINDTVSTEVEETVESSQTSAENSQADVSSNPDAVDTDNTSADKTVEAEAGWDAKTSYEALQKNYDQVSKSYNELRREFTRRTQHESDLQRKIDSLTETIAKATETPIDPKQFFNDLQTQGPKAFEPLLQKRVEAIKQEFEKARQSDQEAMTTMQFELGKLTRRADATNYPDFQKLEPLMAELVADEKVSLDFSQGPGAVLDTLYKLARSMNADNAIKEARKRGRQEADAQAAKEADAKIAGGGKAGSVPDDTGKMDINELRKRFVAELGEAE